MMNSSIPLCLLVFLGCALLAANAELRPFYNYKEKHEIDITARNLQANVQSGTRGAQGRKNPSSGRNRHRMYNDEVYDCESFYGKSHKKDKSIKHSKLYKSDKKKCKGDTSKPGGGYHEHAPPGPQDNFNDFVRFIMVRTEAGSPTPTNFGVGDTLALSGQIYYWRDYEDNLMNDVPVGSFVTLCTGISSGDDLMCTYEIVLEMMTHKDQNGNPRRGFVNSVDGVAAVVANGPNYMGENQMIVTGTEFGFSEFTGGTLITTEDLVNPYLYADLYLL